MAKCLHIKRLGQGDNNLVFFHGWGFDHAIWLPIAQVLARQYKLYLVDLPGFGGASYMSWPRFVKLLLQQLPPYFVMVGWSLGGLLATKLSLQVPQRIIHLVNIASSPCFLQKDNWPGLDIKVFQQFAKNMAINPQRTAQQFIKWQLRDLIGGESYAAELCQRFTMTQQDRLIYLYYLKLLATWDLRAALYSFSQPASYLFGECDTIVSPRTMTIMQQNYPGFNYNMLAAASHLPFLSHQDKFIQWLQLCLP